MVQQKLHSKSNSNQVLNCSPPQQDPLHRNCVDEVILNVIHHAPQQLEEVFPHRKTKKESPHKIFVAAVDRLQTSDTLLRYLKAMEINIRRSSTPEV